MPKTFALALDLKEDASLIAGYDAYHRAVPEPIRASLTEAGILSMDIYRWQNRLVMVIVTTDDFTFERKAKLDEANPDVQAWEKLMSKFQQPLPGSQPGEKWQQMERVFKF